MKHFKKGELVIIRTNGRLPSIGMIAVSSKEMSRYLASSKIPIKSTISTLTLTLYPDKVIDRVQFLKQIKDTLEISKESDMNSIYVWSRKIVIPTPTIQVSSLEDFNKKLPFVNIFWKIPESKLKEEWLHLKDCGKHSIIWEGVVVPIIQNL